MMNALRLYWTFRPRQDDLPNAKLFVWGLYRFKVVYGGVFVWEFGSLDVQWMNN